jgi:hypothetical protein
MRQLKAKEKVMVTAEGLSVHGATSVNQASQSIAVLGSRQELPRIGSSLGHDGRGFTPNQLGAPCPEPAVPAKSQFAGQAIGLGIAALHGLNAKPIANPMITHRKGFEE